MVKVTKLNQKIVKKIRESKNISRKKLFEKELSV